MSAPYVRTVITRGGRGAAAGRQSPGASGAGPSPVLLATMGAACISASAVLIKLANTGAASTGSAKAQR